ncbi:MAG: cysteine dioxygenase type family protein [Hyphomicrobiales bacterium]|nr:cysteine dioxygenase type family protein [Hyphomicrobiales bacterium]
MLIVQEADYSNALSRLSAATSGTGKGYLEEARAALKSMLADRSLLDHVPLERSPGAYTRNFLFGDDKITVYAIIWSAGSQTSIHDHHCSCCFGIWSGSIEESWYEAVDGAHAVLSRQFVRHAGETACMLPSGPNLHKMSNDTGQETISIHIYGYDRQTRPSSIDCEYRLFNGPKSQ